MSNHKQGCSHGNAIVAAYYSIPMIRGAGHWNFFFVLAASGCMEPCWTRDGTPSAVEVCDGWSPGWSVDSVLPAFSSISVLVLKSKRSHWTSGGVLDTRTFTRVSPLSFSQENGSTHVKLSLHLLHCHLSGAHMHILSRTWVICKTLVTKEFSCWGF